MHFDRRIIDTIKLNFEQKSNAQLKEVSLDKANARWSAEAIVADDELLHDRLAGNTLEPQTPEEYRESLPERHYELEHVALGALLGLMTGVVIIPYSRRVEDLDLPVPFGRQMAWLSLDSSDTGSVATALDLRDVSPAAWGAGVEAAHKGSTYVTPPVGDWTLVASTSLFQLPERFVENVKPLLENLSRQFNEVQYFCNHQETGLYAWARGRNGRLVRGFCWLGWRGESLWNEGTVTEGERRLGFQFTEGKRPNIESNDGTELAPLNEDFVFDLASFWSVDPTTLDGEYKVPVSGILGRLSAAGPDSVI